MAPLSAAHLAGLASKSEHEPMGLGQPLAWQYPGCRAKLARSEKEEKTDEYVEEALTGLMVAGEGAVASKEEFLTIQREQPAR